MGQAFASFLQAAPWQPLSQALRPHLQSSQVQGEHSHPAAASQHLQSPHWQGLHLQASVPPAARQAVISSPWPTSGQDFTATAESSPPWRRTEADTPSASTSTAAAARSNSSLLLSIFKHSEYVGGVSSGRDAGRPTQPTDPLVPPGLFLFPGHVVPRAAHQQRRTVDRMD